MFCRAFVAGGIAACGAVTVTHSFETVKIRCACAVSSAPIAKAYQCIDCSSKENFNRKRLHHACTKALCMVSASFSRMKVQRDCCAVSVAP